MNSDNLTQDEARLRDGLHTIGDAIESTDAHGPVTAMPDRRPRRYLAVAAVVALIATAGAGVAALTRSDGSQTVAATPGAKANPEAPLSVDESQRTSTTQVEPQAVHRSATALRVTLSSLPGLAQVRMAPPPRSVEAAVEGSTSLVQGRISGYEVIIEEYNPGGDLEDQLPGLKPSAVYLRLHVDGPVQDSRSGKIAGQGLVWDVMAWSGPDDSSAEAAEAVRKLITVDPTDVEVFLAVRPGMRDGNVSALAGLMVAGDDVVGVRFNGEDPFAAFSSTEDAAAAAQRFVG